MRERFSQRIGRVNCITLFAAVAGLGLTVADLHAVVAGNASGSAAPAPASGLQTDSQAPAPRSPQRASGTLKLNVPTTPVDSGTSFQVPITLTGATNVFSFAIMFDYDPSLVRMTSISPGDFLDRDGKLAPIIQSDSPIGHVVISMSRPSGSHGLDGDGTLCVLSFDAANAGAGELKIERAFVVDNAHNVTPISVPQSPIVVK